MGENGKFGRVNIDISLSGDSRDFNNVSGSGFVVLSNRDLLELNVFGFLSRALSALKLPFGSFDITQFYGPFKIANLVIWIWAERNQEGQYSVYSREDLE